MAAMAELAQESVNAFFASQINLNGELSARRAENNAALALLARRVSDRRDEWSTASTKARRWLAGREQGVEVSSLLS